MKTLLAALLVGGSVIATSGVVLAHHSFAMFDQEHPIQLAGTVKEFRYTSPHTFIILDVKEKDGTSQLWNLEGGAPSGTCRREQRRSASMIRTRRSGWRTIDCARLLVTKVLPSAGTELVTKSVLRAWVLRIW